MLQYSGGIHALLITFIALGVLLGRRARVSWARLWLLATFALYLGQLSKYTIFPVPIDGAMAAAFAREGGSFASGIQWNPISFLHYDQRQIIGNLILMAPLGCLAPFIWESSKRKALAVCIASPFLIEFLQLVISASIGFMYRNFDLGDLTLNLTGALISYAFVKGSRGFLLKH
jgi:glycopeptide antibiotics resistance protein